MVRYGTNPFPQLKKQYRKVGNTKDNIKKGPAKKSTV